MTSTGFAYETAPPELEEVVVTATRTERPADEIPAGVSTVTEEHIGDTRMFGIKEALTGISGVQSESKNGGYDARLIIRGAGLKARYGVREIMILLDGVPITDPDGMTRLDFVDTQLVERIDVVKGPNSTLYGANAAGGVVNIITRSPHEEIKAVKAGYGSDNTQLYNAVFGTSLGKTSVMVNGSRRSTDSWREWNEFSTNQGSIKIGHSFDDTASIEAAISYTEADLQLPGTLTRAQFDGDLSQLTSEPWRHMGRYSEILYTSLKGEKEWGRLTLKPLVYFQKWYHYHPVTGLINDGGANVYGTDIQADLKHTLAGMEGTLTGGVTAQVDDADGDKYTYRDVATGFMGRILFTRSDEKGVLAEVSRDTVVKWGAFLQESLRPSDRWIVDAGIRYDRVRFDIEATRFLEYSFSSGRYVVPSDPVVGRETTFDQVSPRVGVVYKLGKGLNLYGTIATGFQTPQSSELAENPDLDPSETCNYELGMKARFDGGHSVDLALFYITVENDIVQTILSGNDISYSNAGESRKRGIELSGKVRVAEGLLLGGAYTYSDFTFVEFSEVINGKSFTRDGNRFPYIPRHQYSLFASYKHPSGFKARIDTYTWGDYYVDNANSETYGGYDFLTNLLVGYEGEHFDVSFDIYNLFDKRYAMEVTKDSTTTRYRPGAPLTWMARVGYRF
ncbi:MAG: TonB-dependent receptor [Nitrospirota bacterium]